MAYSQGSVLSTTAITVTNNVVLSGLTPGAIYSIESSGGPWHAPAGNQFGLQVDFRTVPTGMVTNDTTVLEQQLLSALGTPIPLPVAPGPANILYVLVGQTGQIAVQVADGTGPFSDNTGALSVVLRNNTATTPVFNPGTVTTIPQLAAEMAACQATLGAILAAVRRSVS
jgi:hypothetical protein